MPRRTDKWNLLVSALLYSIQFHVIWHASWYAILWPKIVSIIAMWVYIKSDLSWSEIAEVRLGQPQFLGFMVPIIDKCVTSHKNEWYFGWDWMIIVLFDKQYRLDDRISILILFWINCFMLSCWSRVFYPNIYY